MPIDETITNNPSSTAVPTAALTDILMSSQEQGQAVLEVQQPNGGPWIPVASGNGSFVVNTPDITLNYRFRPLQSDKEVRVYMS